MAFRSLRDKVSGEATVRESVVRCGAMQVSRSGAWRFLLLLLTVLLFALPAAATTWYVRADGGNRFSKNVPDGQCDGLADAPYPGHGNNQHCAFNDIRLLWQDGSYAYAPQYENKFPGNGWVGQGGDTYLVKGSIAAGTAPYRVGWESAEGNGCAPAMHARYGDACYRGWRGDGAAGPPTPPAGTAAQHTRILGENWQNCHAQSARTPVVAGWGASTAFNLATSYVDVQCFDISDRSDCKDSCSGKDVATEGIALANTADHLLLQDIRVHGMRTFGLFGPSGDGDVFRYISLIGNGGGGWNADPGDGKNTGTGTLLVQHYEIKWNGCAEEYPIRDPLPYQDCTDQNSGGYGDGFGTATVASKPGWKAHFDQGEVAYNTQDGLDALHLIGEGSSLTVTRTLAYGNMGQQIKVGGAAGKAVNNLIVGNCRALSTAMPGTPHGFNAKLSDYCRASDVAVLLTVGRGALTRFENNTVYASGTIGVDVECDTSTGACDATSQLSFQNNLILGFANGPRNGNKDGDDRNPTALYNNSGVHPFTNRGSIFRNNTVFHQRPNEPCPLGRFDRDAVCASPMLRDETWHTSGFGDMRPLPGGKSAGSGASIPGIEVDFAGKPRPAAPSRGAMESGDPAPRSGMIDATEGDEAGGGGKDLPPLTLQSAGETFSESDELPSEESTRAVPHLPHHLLRQTALCSVALGAGAGLFLLGRATSRSGGRSQG